ncbi:Gfo/Idh/MocA family protein [Paenibacillus eucommiae]|uniref:Dehydrogenase n=1 Tax=Paenibacillus eucommiae TaxID=1355755 RepID=A0ABS4IVY6_9BACL|nr:Gfo/Idh/MocA family oxidoreductase [Paenibacillus eucommiae]MBP1991758.1 putative dehydrogenase [Paenibacillus eucommiae]
MTEGTITEATITKVCKAAIIGINGFGGQHLKQMLLLQDEGLLEVVSVCESRLSQKDNDLLGNRGISLYSDYKEMLRLETRIDFVVIATPIHLHAPMGLAVMEAGYHVLLEKPPAAVIQDIDRLIEVSKRTGKHCAVNFQMLSGKAFTELLHLLEQGALGPSIQTITGTGILQRTDDYFKRARWSGKLHLDGSFVLDGTIHNTAAHILNNMLRLATASNRLGSAAPRPIQVTGELYRANDIEGEDTSCMRIRMSDQTELYYYATLCSKESPTPSIRVEGTAGTAVWTYDNTLTIEKDGEVIRYDYGAENYLSNMYMNLLHTIRGDGQELICPVQAARNYMLVSNGAFESSRRIHAIAPPYRHELLLAEGGDGSDGSDRSDGSNGSDGSDARIVIVNDIADAIQSVSSSKQLFSEAGLPWAISTQPFDLKEYDKFPKWFE